MHEIGYKLLLETSKKRRIDLLTLLLEIPNSIPIMELAHYSEVSKKTIERDIQFLIHQLPNSLIISKHQNSLSLKKMNNVEEIKLYIDSVIKDNPLFSIVKIIFYGHYETLSSLSEKFFMGESTLRKHFLILKKVLKEYDLTLNLNPIEILGNEGNIRYFFFHYFTQGQSEEVNDKKIQHSKFYNTLQHLQQNYGLVPNIDHHRLAQWLFILEQRVNLNKLVRFEEPIFSKYATLPVFTHLRVAIKSEFKNEILGQLNDHEIIFAYLITLDTIVYDKNTYFFSNDFSADLNKFENLTTHYFCESNLYFAPNMDLKITLQAFLTNLKLLSDISPIFQKNPLNLRRLIENKHNTILSTWLKLLKNDDTFVYHYDVAISLTAITSAKIDINRRVLFSITGAPSTVAYVKSLVLRMFSSSVDVFFVFDKPLNNNLIETMNIDLCVCNFVISQPITACELFIVSAMPLDSEWQNLSNKLGILQRN